MANWQDFFSVLSGAAGNALASMPTNIAQAKERKRLEAQQALEKMLMQINMQIAQNQHSGQVADLKRQVDEANAARKQEMIENMIRKLTYKDPNAKPKEEKPNPKIQEYEYLLNQLEDPEERKRAVLAKLGVKEPTESKSEKPPTGWGTIYNNLVAPEIVGGEETGKFTLPLQTTLDSVYSALTTGAYPQNYGQPLPAIPTSKPMSDEEKRARLMELKKKAGRL